MTITNARLPVARRFFGKHFVPGCAGGYDNNGNSTIYINQDTAKKMNTTFQGCAVYVEHVNKIDPDKKDGTVVRAFFNEKDGQHWVEFMVDTQEALDKIAQGWRLSNAYHPIQKGGGGEWNGIPYDEEILDGAYEHLAIVENPRYDESIILSPEDFEAYNKSKETDLKRFLNSKSTKEKGEKTMSLKWFKKTTVENAKDIDGMSVTLPKSGIEMTMAQVVNAADEAEVEKKKPAEERMANGDDMVDCFGGKMKVNELVKQYNAYKVAEDEKKNAEVDDDEDMANEADDDEDSVESLELVLPESPVLPQNALLL